MKSLKVSILAIVLLFTYKLSVVTAQEGSKIKVNLGADLVSNYIWRGSPSIAPDGSTTTHLSPNFQPTLSLSGYGLTLGAWASYDFIGEYHETDLFLSYAAGPLTFTINDYFWTYNTPYFNYKSDKTAHIIEGSVAFAGVESLPLTASFNVMLYGADKKYYSDSLETDSTKQNYSTYLELGYPLKVGEMTISPFIGMTFTDGYYGDGYKNIGGGKVEGFQVVNIGLTSTKSLEVSDKLSIPVKCSLIFNPVLDKAFLVVGFTF
jgi:hypothetical protein